MEYSEDSSAEYKSLSTDEDSTGKPLIADRCGDQVQLYFTA